MSATVLPAVAQAPSINPSGVVPIYSSVNQIQPGEWISIFGNNLASGAATWSGNFPTSLGGTSVRINGRAAYLWYVSPGQINAQAPDDTTTGIVPVTVTTAGGTATATVVLAPSSPSFSLLDGRHVSGIILRPDNSGTAGGGAYDILGPTGTSLGYPTVAAQPGDTVELFGVGFGPTSPPVPAGQEFTGAAPVTANIVLSINSASIKPSFVGLSGAGLYQINFTAPGSVGAGDLAIEVLVGGVPTQHGALISLEPLLPTVTLPASSVSGGTSLTGIVSLPAAAGGGSVVLQSSSPSVSVPDSVLIPAGQTSVNFTVTTHAVASTQQATITGIYVGASKSTSLTVTPTIPPPAFTVMSSRVTFQPAQAPVSARVLTLLPDLDGSYTATIDNLTFPHGSISADRLTYNFSSVQPGETFVVGNFLYTLTAGTLQFTLTPKSPGPDSVYTQGALSGTLSLSGTNSGGGLSTFTGLISGTYAGQ